MKFSVFSNMKDWIKAIMVAFILFFLMRFIVFQFIGVNNSSMEDTLLSGDYVFVNKYSYGARIPLFKIPILLNFKKSPFISLRIPGTSKIMRNDLLVFQYPVTLDNDSSSESRPVKRCIALPGDTVLIKNKRVWINHHEKQNPALSKYNYIILASKSRLKEDFFVQYNVFAGSKSLGNSYIVPLTNTLVKRIACDPMVAKVTPFYANNPEQDQMIFPQSNSIDWTTDDFGPLYIPKYKSSVRLTSKNVSLYQVLIEKYEGNTLELRGNRVFINGKESTTYTFKQNYYFVLDDNRDDAKDSRYWGLLPENHIIGKATMIMFSVGINQGGYGKIRWSRFFKKLN
jgi:signal peptidase I